MCLTERNDASARQSVAFSTPEQSIHCAGTDPRPPRHRAAPAEDYPERRRASAPGAH